MATLEAIQGAIRAAITQQDLARYCNKRAGQELFPVLDKQSLTAHLLERLNGARCVSEIADIEQLALPPLDQALVDQVFRDNPDEIFVPGLRVRTRVNYTAGALPTTTVDSNLWQQIPDEGVKLPGGREVEIFINFDHRTVLHSSDVSQLKAQVREHLNREQWERWSKPSIEAPNLDAADYQFPVIAAVYGRCVVTGEELTAYGTVILSLPLHATALRVEEHWERSEASVRAVARDMQERLPQLRDRWLSVRELVLATEQANAAREELRAAAQGDEFHRLPLNLRYEVQEKIWGRVPTTLTTTREWTDATKRLVATVKGATAEVARKQAEEEKEERESLAPILERIGTSDLSTARSIRDFADSLARITGGSDSGWRLINRAVSSSGSRIAQQMYLRDYVPGLGISEMGSRFCYMRDIAQIGAWIDGANGWLKSKLDKEAAAAQLHVKKAAAAGASASSGKLDLSALGGLGARIVDKRKEGR